MRKSKDEIVHELRTSFRELCELCDKIEQPIFNQSLDDKWTPAENFQHLITATRMTSMAFRLPKFVPVLLYGRPKRTSHGFSKVVDNYRKKLNEGAKASGAYVPTKTNYDKLHIQKKLQSEGNKLVEAIFTKWNDDELDKRQVLHPILGLITHRELAYFTIHHNGHHLETVRTLYLT